MTDPTDRRIAERRNHLEGVSDDGEFIYVLESRQRTWRIYGTDTRRPDSDRRKAPQDCDGNPPCKKCHACYSNYVAAKMAGELEDNDAAVPTPLAPSCVPVQTVEGHMPSCHRCGTIMDGVCPKCGATTTCEDSRRSTFECAGVTQPQSPATTPSAGIPPVQTAGAPTNQEWMAAISRAMGADEEGSVWTPGEVEDILRDALKTARERSDLLDKSERVAAASVPVPWPDMWWPDDDPEMNCDPDDELEENYAEGAIVEFQTAFRGPQKWGFWRKKNDDTDNSECFYFDSKQEAEQAFSNRTAPAREGK